MAAVPAHYYHYYYYYYHHHHHHHHHYHLSSIHKWIRWFMNQLIMLSIQEATEYRILILFLFFFQQAGLPFSYNADN